MFINVTENELKLYELQIYPGLKDVINKIIADCPFESYEKKDVRFGLLSGDIINNNDLVILDECIDTRNWIKVDENNFGNFRRVLQDVFIYKYRLVHLVDLYFTLEGLQNDKNISYSNLEVLNNYALRKYDGLTQDLFNKYENEIFENIKLIELYSGSSTEILRLFNSLYDSASDGYRKQLNEVKNMLNVNYMNILNIPSESSVASRLSKYFNGEKSNCRIRN